MKDNLHYIIIGALLLVTLFIFNSESKPKRRKSKVSKLKKSCSNKTVTRMKPKPKSINENIKALKDMPKKYRNGCKGKKGRELGLCLRYWRKYRLTNPKK